MGAIGIALLFWGGVSQVIYVVRPILTEGFVRLINHHIRTSPGIHFVLKEYPIIWKISGACLWFGFLCWPVAVMLARWLYAPEKQS
jgi:hypothetical protein